jgi:site-specific recombinase XerD
MVKSFSFIFYLKKSKNHSERLVPIYLRITVDGKRAELSTGREVDPESWNNKAGLLNGKSEQIRQFNAYLETLRNKVYEAHQALIRENKEITAESLKNKYTGSGEKKRMLISIFKKHNEEVNALVNQGFAPGTAERYKTSLSHTLEFIKWKFKVSDIDIKVINHEFITDYDFYLRTERKCANNTAIKYIKNFKKIIRICIANGWLDRDPFVRYKPKLKEVERHYLTTGELQVLSEKQFSMDRLNQVKDLFLFSCYTGLAYIDVSKLTLNNLVIGIDGNHWIKTHRTKTDIPSNIPLLPPAMAIINKYREHPAAVNKGRLLPVPSNQKLNAYLKEIADLCEIKKDLTYHIARHTFATTVTLSNGISLESVSKMLGHKNMRTTQHYAKILDQKVSQDMSVLFKKFENDNKLKKAANK